MSLCEFTELVCLCKFAEVACLCEFAEVVCLCEFNLPKSLYINTSSKGISAVWKRMENKLYSNIACIKEVKVEIEVIKEGNKDVKDKIEEVKR